MKDVAVRVQGLGKQYRVGARQTAAYGNLRESVMHALRLPLRPGRQSSGTEQPRGFWALKDVTFDVGEGEVLGIIGRNGAGKSTLLKILSRITEPTSGEADVHGLLGSLLEIGTGFHPELTGRENILLSGVIGGMSKADIERRFDEIVDFAEVEQFLDTPVKRYSSGMYLRLAFSVAAHLESDVLLMDEVLAVGDAAFQEKCLGRMGSAAREGRTVLFVSHNLSAISQICQTGLVLSNGSVAHHGSASSAVDFYLSSHAQHTGRLLDHLQHLDINMILDTITVNGSPGDRLELGPGPTVLEIEVTGRLHQQSRVGLEARISDDRERALATFSPGHEAGGVPLHTPGTFVLRESIQLPRLNRGNYYVSLYLTNPNIMGWADLPYALRIVSPGSPSPTGFVFDYDQGAGWTLLSSGQSTYSSTAPSVEDASFSVPYPPRVV